MKNNNSINHFNYLRSVFILLMLFTLGGFKFSQVNNEYDNPAKLHFIMFADKYSNVAESCSTDEKLLTKQLRHIANKTQMDLEIYTGDFSPRGVERALNRVNASENDAIMFYYSGHGFRYRDQSNRSSKFPYMFLSKEDGHPHEVGMSLESVKDKLRSKGARLVLVFGNLCNNSIKIDEPVRMPTDFASEAYKRLFLFSEGYLISSSSVPGQYSYATNKGGIFTLSFLEAMQEQTTARQGMNLTWNKLLDETKEKALERSSDRQRPQYQAKINLRTEVVNPGSVIIPGE
ncbi:MAG: caspase family protein [Bacteroidota bacterium]